LTLESAIYLEVQRSNAQTLLELLSGGQLAIRDVIVPLAHRIDFDNVTGLASRYWPLGPTGRVILDPNVCFGAPSLHNRSVRTSAIADFYHAERQSVDAAMSWFEIAREDVGAALRFEKSLVAA
jgi:uncharacterized protein (DUF433 family)